MEKSPYSTCMIKAFRCDYVNLIVYGIKYFHNDWMGYYICIILYTNLRIHCYWYNQLIA